MEGTLLLQKGIQAQSQGDLSTAEAYFSQALNTEARRIQAEAHSRLGVIQIIKNNRDLAKERFERAIATDPDFMPAYHNMGLMLYEQGRFQEAENICKAGIEKNPSYGPLYTSVGMALKGQGKLGKAEEMFNKAIDFEPKNSAVYTNLGGIIAETGKQKEAQVLFEEAIKLDPMNSEAHRMLSLCKKYKKADPHIQQMEHLLTTNVLQAQTSSSIQFALGKAYDDLKDYETAFQHYNEANRIMRSLYHYETSESLNLIQKIKSFFTLDFINKHKSEDINDSGLIFVVGMPRSGTSLVEQMLASHPDVCGAGELPYINEIYDSFFSISKNFSPVEIDGKLHSAVKTYLSAIERHRDGRKYVVDKMPANFRYIGLIKLLFPQAKIIHCCRNPAAICLSMFRTKFTGTIPYAYDLKELAEYYLLYDDLMAYWKKLLPGFIHDVQYAELVAEPERTIRGMLEYCDLPWSEQCLAFHKTNRSSMTASAFDIKRSLYTDAVDKWKNYEPYLDVLIKNLYVLGRVIS